MYGALWLVTVQSKELEQDGHNKARNGLREGSKATNAASKLNPDPSNHHATQCFIGFHVILQKFALTIFPHRSLQLRAKRSVASLDSLKKH